MLRWFAKRLSDAKKEEKGFTLIELLIVIIIIGILAAIALPTFLAQRDKAVVATCRSDARNAAEAAVLYAADTADGSFTGISVAGLEANGFNATTGYATAVAGPDANGDITITTTCPAPAGGTATWTTAGSGGAAAGEVRGEVVYNPPGP